MNTFWSERRHQQFTLVHIFMFDLPSVSSEDTVKYLPLTILVLYIVLLSYLAFIHGPYLSIGHEADRSYGMTKICLNKMFPFVKPEVVFSLKTPLIEFYLAKCFQFNSTRHPPYDLDSGQVTAICQHIYS